MTDSGHYTWHGGRLKAAFLPAGRAIGILAESRGVKLATLYTEAALVPQESSEKNNEPRTTVIELGAEADQTREVADEIGNHQNTSSKTISGPSRQQWGFWNR